MMKNQDVFAVMGDGTRRKILLFVKDEPKSVNNIVDELGTSQPTVSKHLKVLRDANLVATETEGRHRYYSLNAAALEPLADFLNNFEKPTDKKKPRGKFGISQWGKLRKD